MAKKSPEKSFKCVMCNKKFKSQKSLSRHLHYYCTGGW